MKIAFFGSSLVSAYWNGAATYYRGLLSALAQRGHEIVFFEPDAYERQQHRDRACCDWATIIVYEPEEAAARGCLKRAETADLVIKASGVGVLDEMLEQAVLELQAPSRAVAFWDVDAPATLERIQTHREDPFRDLVPQYDLVVTYGGGDRVVREYETLGARRTVPIYNAVDPVVHHPAPPDARFLADVSFLGNRLPDREQRVERFFLEPAVRLPQAIFVLGGSGWDDKPVPPNVRYLGHIYTHEHNAFNCSTKVVLNINRDSMAAYGFSPPTRIFEAAGAGACLLTDAWPGLDQFLEPGKEVLVAENGREVAEQIAALSPAEAARLGEAARQRVLSEHTYTHRAIQLESVLAREGMLH